MTILEFLRGVLDVATIVLLSLVLLELREERINRIIRENKRRRWVKEEHE